MTLSKVREAEAKINRERSLAGKKPIEVKQHKLKGLSAIAVMTLKDWYNHQWDIGIIFKGMKLTSFCEIVNAALLVDPDGFLIELTKSSCRRAIISIGKVENHPVRESKPKVVKPVAATTENPPLVISTQPLKVDVGATAEPFVDMVSKKAVLSVLSTVINRLERLARFQAAHTNLLLRTSVKRDTDDDFDQAYVLSDTKYVDDMNALGISGNKEDLSTRQITVDDIFIGPRLPELDVITNLGERKRLKMHQGRFVFTDDDGK